MIVSRQFLRCHSHNAAGQIRPRGSPVLVGQEQPEHSQDGTMWVVNTSVLEGKVGAAFMSFTTNISFLVFGFYHFLRLHLVVSFLDKVK